MSLKSVGPAQDSSPSDESWTELYDRTCRESAPAVRERGGGKRPLPPEFVPEKRIKRDAPRLSFVGNKETIKAHCTHHLAAVDGTRAIVGMEAALTAWVAAQCDRVLDQELSAGDAHCCVNEVDAAKRRELDAWSKF